MLLDKRLFTSCMAVTDSGKYAREHLTYICIDYKEDTKILSIVGTNAQVMIVNEKKITDEEDQKFCAANFSEGQTGYKLPESVLNSKNPYVVFSTVDGCLVCDGTFVKKYDGAWVNWRAVVPTVDLVPAKFYASFDPNLVKLISKALGYSKNEYITDGIPLVNSSENEDPIKESRTPHVWKTIDEADDKQTVILMPRRLD